ncbi:hypothetical protein KM176_16495 [Pseudooceanicola sp. CBS1P-1]|uniref:Phage major capsid protein n=1 Tax=Pseudooceanicola albus TaxID=2692189 RepID=A0A6L7G8V1_9RHOB|nr:MULTISPECIES: hypothetical protein [Pseudooceanicola]MBT9385475.1 hypothetical protein [Pseudooceanicola endophyticus]MXN19113.1 hypothetical protein [Pseudooceanicola albus]
MVQTLIEYAKTFAEDDKRRAIIELFPEMLDFMSLLPFKPAPGGVYRYQEEAALPDNMGFRAINELPGEGHGLLNDRVEQVFPIAGNVDVDRALVRRHGSGRRTIDERMSIKKKAKVWADTFIDGDNQSSPREYTGLKARLAAVGGSVDGTNYRSRILANSEASGGGALSLAQLDRAIGLVNDPNALIMPKAIKDRFAAAQRDTNIGGYITLDKDEMGRPITRYGDLPIFTGYGISPFGEFIPFDEVAYGGGSAVTSSIYVVRFGEDGVCGLETAPMEVTDFGLLQDGVYMRVNIEHDCGICVEDPFSALRMSSVTNAAIVK